MPTGEQCEPANTDWTENTVMARPRNIEALRELFTYHAPDASRIKCHEAIRAAGRCLAETIFHGCPEGPATDNAITRVREAVAWANAAIACGGQ